MSLDELEALLTEKEATDKRLAAEVAYVLASRYRAEGRAEQATAMAQRSIALFDACDMGTIEACASRYVTLGNVALPSLIHADLVRSRFVA